MRALVFGDFTDTPDFEVPPGANHLVRNLATTPVALRTIDDPKLLGPDWVVIRPRLTGICGSDGKQVFMDMVDSDGGSDLTMTAFISFPQVLGHEVVADVVEVGPEAKGVAVGDRVLLNCWLSCGPRGISPMCPPCRHGDFSNCWNFTKGRLTPGIHSGNSSDATGGFAELMPAHDSMVFKVPDDVSDEVAVLADPFAVSLHAITRTRLPERGRVVVWGAGALGTTSIAILRGMHPGLDVATVARHPAQQALARKLGAHVVDSEQEPEAIVRALAEWSGAELLSPWEGLPIAYPGAVDVVFDTIGSPQSVEQGLRVVATHGVITVTGVSAPERFEWGPLYFKEVQLVGSNAFGFEEVDGVRKHAIEHYLDMVRAGRIDVSPMLTHTFRLEEWIDAFTTIANQHETGAIKVAFDFR